MNGASGSLQEGLAAQERLGSLTHIIQHQARFAMVAPLLFDSISPFVLSRNDSSAAYADTSRTSLALSDRLAGDQSHRAVSACRWSMRALQAAAWTPGGTTRRIGRRVVGSRCASVARRSRSRSPATAPLRSARRNPFDAQARLSCDGAPQPRSKRQRPTLAQSRRAMPALPYDPRCGGASAPSMVECVPTTCARRPLYRPLQLTRRTTDHIRRWRCSRPVHPTRHHSEQAFPEARMPMGLRSDFAGELGNVRGLSTRMDGSDAATAAER